MIVTSNSNEKIKYINSLKDKKFRDKYDKYILEGIKLVDEYINSAGDSPEFIVISKQILLKNAGGTKLYEKIKNYDNLLEVDEKVFKHITDTKTPQGILIVLDKMSTCYEDIIKSVINGEKVIILDKVSDAGNLGTIIRCAVAFGIKNIICTKGTVDMYMPKVIRSTMGAIYKLNIIYVDYTELESMKNDFKKLGFVFIGTDLSAKKYLHERGATTKNIYVLGNEANGVSDKIKNMCDDFVKIKIEDTQESLNVAQASTILMYDMYIKGN